MVLLLAVIQCPIFGSISKISYLIFSVKLYTENIYKCMVIFNREYTFRRVSKLPDVRCRYL